MAQNTLSPRVQVDAVVAKARSMLTFAARTFERPTPDISLPVYSALVRPPLDCCIPAWWPNTARHKCHREIAEISTRSIPEFLSWPTLNAFADLSYFRFSEENCMENASRPSKSKKRFCLCQLRWFICIPYVSKSSRASIHSRQTSSTYIYRQQSFGVGVINNYKLNPTRVIMSPSIDFIDGEWPSVCG